jgi:cyclase
MGWMSNSVWATNSGFDFSVTPIAENVYSIIAPSFGLPTAQNKGWNSNSHFIRQSKWLKPPSSDGLL